MKTLEVFDTFGNTIIQGFLLATTQGLKSEFVPPKDHAQNEGDACVPNISPRERLKRLIGGLIPFVISLAILTWLISINANRLWRLPLFLLFVGAASGLFQWRDKT
jgi:predicted CDP-diglyceride synthetase/phosphatidate cytidylyltransferase